MASSVKLYVYDLSNGLARQLSQQLTGRQIDGIWHTSVVVFGKEIFYGQGISVTAPGRSHHGTPLQVLDMGETSIDQETFQEYLDQMRQHYTADKYHFLEFNCNSFTNDCVGFLTGGSIPSFIKDLPSDFLSTPLGAALRPTIDGMFRRPSPGPLPVTPTANSADPQLAASISQTVSPQAQSSAANQTTLQLLTATQTLTAPIHISTNSASFNNLLHTHHAVVAFFTSATCPPCRMIEPVFERLSEEKGIKTGGGGRGAAFTKVDLGTGMGGMVAKEWGVRATPTFIFYLDGKKISELRGADANELRTQVDLLIFQAFPPHPHTSISLPVVQAMSLRPILFPQVPSLDTVFSKLSSFIEGCPSWSSDHSQLQVKQVLSEKVIPYLRARFSPPSEKSDTLPSAAPALLLTWNEVTSVLVQALPIESLFPVVDMWRLAVLDPAVGEYWSSHSSNLNINPLTTFLAKANSVTQDPTSTKSRNYILTVLRLLCNTFSSKQFMQYLLSDAFQGQLVTLLVSNLLHQDASVRSAAASLMFNIAAHLQEGRVEKVRSGSEINDGTENEDWEVELITATVEAIDRETENEEVVHRLAAAFALLLRCSPFYETQLVPLLEVLQARNILRNKLIKGGCGEDGVKKKEVRSLIEEVASKLCV